MKKRPPRPPVRFEIPVGASPKSCLSCGARIFFIETARGKRMPVDPDGISHFATCTAASKWRGRSRDEVRQGELFGDGKK